ncbi:4-coumarate--CoA ligase-like protein [Hapsidospora chrysogenum ATCC 11550]|uniref:4-coumarate--CoA ligase-like protein n=1 Tax=Hapsidospora chrysogenum (strain ATCC 11550 / CBS 779.69 / DSM 880 / IAM 14645 / JCM 23072 / IMI 49137) TaxID=857340 RepID=A0A086SYJ1_HAPC1|nr:4-coumarate--CoA ligase-like protein [Hapsidospora chrysogenum ATCC 11550]
MTQIIFKSRQPDINLPKDVSIWSWLFEPPHSKLDRHDATQGYTNVATGEHISYTDLKQLTTYLSTALSDECGLGQGESLIIYARNSVWYPVAMLSAVRIGAVGCGVSPEYTADELAHAIRVSRASMILTTADNLDRAHQAASKVGVPRSSVILLEEEEEEEDDDGDAPAAGKRTQSLQDLIRQAKARGEARQIKPYRIPSSGEAHVVTNHDVCAYLGFSSGTTGMPKAVMISHANVVAQCLQIQQITPADHDRILAALPFYHITGLVHQLHLPIVLNAHAYVMPTFTLDGMLRTVSEHKIKEMLLVPPILMRLVREPGLVSKYDLSHVRRFSSGAAPLSQEILTLLERQFPGTGFKQGYGMTESCSCITAHPPARYAYKYAAKVGAIVASTEVRIVDPETGRDCGVGEPGEIWARGPQVAMGYLDNARATAETCDGDGFLHTGDIGQIDDEGLLSITDRLKEMVKVKGIGVAPAELENLLLGHPAVKDCAVCGIADDRAGERPKAFVVLGKEQHKTRDAEGAARELIAFVKENKARHKWIVEVEVLDEIPKSPAGKILRKVLRQPSRTPGEVVVRDGPIRSKL